VVVVLFSPVVETAVVVVAVTVDDVVVSAVVTVVAGVWHGVFRCLRATDKGYPP
jgi:hypothetical protein